MESKEIRPRKSPELEEYLSFQKYFQESNAPHTRKEIDRLLKEEKEETPVESFIINFIIWSLVTILVAAIIILLKN